jgi:non-heme chloroperoxidase
VPTLRLDGDADRILLIACFALLSAKTIQLGALNAYERAPPGMCGTVEDRVNAGVLAFIEV